MRSRTGRLLGALGLAAFSSEAADAARKSARRNDSRGHTNDEPQGNQNEGEEQTQDGQESDPKNDSKASAEGKGTENESGKSGNHDRNQNRSANNESSAQNESDSGKGRGDSHQRNTDSHSTSRENPSADDDSQHHGDPHVRRFAQKAADQTQDAPPADSTAGDVPDATTITPANPNDVIDQVPSTSLNDLLVQGNDHVIASVSTSGGFAFARSGDVIAVTGPDGASIIQSDGVSTGTGTGTSNPTEPSDDGGNNDVGFSS